MRLPAIRLPSIPMPSEWFEGLISRRTVLYALYTGVLFIVFLIANFPHNVIVQRVLKSVDLSGQGLRLEVGDTRFAWWRGYELQGVRLTPTDPDALPLMEASSLYVRPGLEGLMRGEINSLHLLGLMYGGAVDGTVAMGDGVRRATIALDGLQLHRYPALTSLLQLRDGAVAGNLSGVITIESHGDDNSDTRAQADVGLDKASLTDATLTNGLALPALHFDRAAMKLSMQGGRVEVQEFEASGPELRLSASGQVVLREPITDSVLNLKFTALPGANSPDEVRTLLSIIPPPPKGAKPDAPRTINGTLARPRLR
jgi:type II secretion system protein N